MKRSVTVRDGETEKIGGEPEGGTATETKGIRILRVGATSGVQAA